MTIDWSKWHSWVIKFHLGQSPVGLITRVTLMWRVCVCGINTGCCTPLLCFAQNDDVISGNQRNWLYTKKTKKNPILCLIHCTCVSCLFLRKKIILSRIIIKSLYARLPCLLFLILFTTPFYYRNKIAIKRSVFCQCSFPFLLVLLVTINFLWCSRLLKHVCLKSSGHFSIKHIHISWNLQINKCKRRFYLLSSVQIVFYLRMPEW